MPLYFKIVLSQGTKRLTPDVDIKAFKKSMIQIKASVAVLSFCRIMRKCYYSTTVFSVALVDILLVVILYILVIFMFPGQKEDKKALYFCSHLDETYLYFDK